MVQFHRWPNQIDKKNFGIWYFQRVWQAQTLHILHKILVQYKPIVAAENNLGANKRT